MSVIAKMYALNNPRIFPDSQQVDLTVVYDDRLMTIRDPATTPGRVLENQTFSTASPSGDARFNMPLTHKVHRLEEYYLIFIEQDSTSTPHPPAFPKAIMVAKIRCVSITDFGGTSKQVEMCSESSYDHETRKTCPNVHPNQSHTFNLRMSIDNPHASIQFKPGTGGYWIGLYPANDFSMLEALEDAHP